MTTAAHFETPMTAGIFDATAAHTIATNATGTAAHTRHAPTAVNHTAARLGATAAALFGPALSTRIDQ
jgi:hypothetical protein